MEGFEYDKPGRIETKPKCDICGESLEHSCCIHCNEKLGDDFYCSNHGDESWHTCKKCYDYLKNLKCPKCKSERISRWGVDLKRVKHIQNECKECKFEWTTKK